jgi:hypothetical protein
MTRAAYIKDYPRPQFVREDWMNLNAQASGIGIEEFHPQVWYSKSVHIPKQKEENRVIRC